MFRTDLKIGVDFMNLFSTKLPLFLTKYKSIMIFRPSSSSFNFWQAKIMYTHMHSTFFHCEFTSFRPTLKPHIIHSIISRSNFTFKPTFKPPSYRDIFLTHLFLHTISLDCVRSFFSVFPSCPCFQALKNIFFLRFR